MASRQQLLRALDEADAAGNTQDAEDIAAMLKAEQFEQPKQKEEMSFLEAAKQSNRQAFSERQRQHNRANALLTDTDFNQDGVPNASVRADVSRGDTPEEREVRLAKHVGEENVLRDKFGNLALTQEGAKKLGVKTDKPIIFDEPEFSRHDIADLRGDALPIAAGVGVGIATGGMSLLPSMALTGLATAGGKGLEEGIEHLQGDNLQSLGEVGEDIAIEGALGAGGEVLGRAAIGIGKKLLQPGVATLKEGAEEAITESLEQGIIPRVENVRRGKLIGRFHGLVDTIFGDRNAAKNSTAIGKSMEKMRKAFNQEVIPDADELGQQIVDDVIAAKHTFSKAAADMYAWADDTLNGFPSLDIKGLKKQATDLIESLPKTTLDDGTVVPSSLDPGVLQNLRKLASLDDQQTLSAVQTIRRQLRDRLEGDILTPGVKSHEAKLLLDSMDSVFDEHLTKLGTADLGGIGGRAEAVTIARNSALKQLKDANDFYKSGIDKFKAFSLKKIVKDPSKAAALDPEEVVDFVLKKKTSTSVNRIFEVLPEETKAKVQTVAMDRILNSMTSGGDTFLDEAVFNGTTFTKTLDKYGENTLNTLFGEQQTKGMRSLANAITLASRVTNTTSGGLVAASIAVRPLQNLPLLGKLFVLRNVMSSEASLKYLTTGIRFGPNSVKGARALARVGAQIQTLSDKWSVGAGFNESTAPQ